ncbi:hypothetical protein HS088_TW17G01008 [Tripterygium wilfordii]|uniref:GDP-fucose protein O-fucosyltransferase 2 n=1 Tax=Tripterygium wilfordii TaxID=458696 RepID=A0A7J7CHF1_TRIWF|nr:O-fucosyltransferase 36 [Tripterygium wilfordii]KAF5733464.1 hypothetical protein HS088_TW17G01008 [Tripterygium wilfordii]
MMERDFSSDDDDDRHNLIDQNERNNHRVPIIDTTTASTTSPRSTFHVDDEDLESRRVAGNGRIKFNNLFNFNFHKRYLFAIFLPLFIVLVYFSANIRDLFSVNHSSMKLDSLSLHMREAELQALYLLRQQQLELLTLYNRTFINSSISNVNNSGLSSSSLFEDVQSVLLKQLSRNKEIQQSLLSPHKSGNVSAESENGGLLPFGVEYGFDRCRKVDQKSSERKTIEWKPRSNKFLFAICLSGQMSNHLICLEKHMFFAALLNRVLVIPSSKFDYQYSRVLDIEHINECLGRKLVISFDEFAEIKKDHMHIDKFICYFSLPELCYVDEEHLKKLKGLGISMGDKLESPWVEDIKKPSKRTVQDVQAKFSSDADVIAVGDVFFADVEKEWVMQPGGPIAHKCKTLIEPSRLILTTAQRFIQTFLGKNYIALHFRRHGFLKFCNLKNRSCFYPIPQAADCITKVVERVNAPVIYLSTDAAESETGLLQSLVVLNGKTVPLVKRPARNSAEKWDALLYRHGIEGDSQVEAMLDKTICAMSSVFIGTSGSTFTDDILRLRKDWGSASVCDEYLCQGEEPNFIAENE